MKIIPDRRRAE